MKKIICLILAALVLASVSSVNAAGHSKRHQSKKAAHPVTAKHPKNHHSWMRHHKHA
jgi:hypothetical protein